MCIINVQYDLVKKDDKLLKIRLQRKHNPRYEGKDYKQSLQFTSQRLDFTGKLIKGYLIMISKGQSYSLN